MDSLTKADVFDRVRSDGGAYVFWRPVGGIGDAIMLLPAITAVKEQAGNTPVVVSCIDYVGSVFENHPYIDYLLTYSPGEISTEKIDKVDLKILEHYGSVIHRLFEPCPAAIYEAKHNPFIMKPRQEIFCEHCGVEFDINNYNFTLTESEKHIPETIGISDRYIVVQLRSHDKWRDYKHIKWLLYELVKLGNKIDFQVVTIDAEKVYDVAGVKAFVELPLRVVYGIISGALAVVSLDSAFAHIAGALSIPVLGLYGPTNPKVRLRYHNAHWMPPFRRCRRQYCWYSPCKFRFCLSALKPRKIVKRLRTIIQEVE